MRSPKEIILSALYSACGDDLERAQAAWGHLSDAELDREHGQSGKTKRELLRSWQEHRREVDDAIRYAEKLP